MREEHDVVVLTHRVVIPVVSLEIERISKAPLDLSRRWAPFPRRPMAVGLAHRSTIDVWGAFSDRDVFRIVIDDLDVDIDTGLRIQIMRSTGRRLDTPSVHPCSDTPEATGADPRRALVEKIQVGRVNSWVF